MSYFAKMSWSHDLSALSVLLGHSLEHFRTAVHSYDQN